MEYLSNPSAVRVSPVPTPTAVLHNTRLGEFAEGLLHGNFLHVGGAER